MSCRWPALASMVAFVSLASCLCDDRETKMWTGPSGHSVHLVERDCGATTRTAFHFEDRNRRWFGTSATKILVVDCPFGCDASSFDVQWSTDQRATLTIPPHARIFGAASAVVDGRIYEVIVD